MNAADTQRGHLFVIAAPSGAGKTTLVHRLLRENRNLRFSVSYTTRSQRSTETNGVDYHFITPEVFQTMVDAGDFLEHAKVFDYQYGTSKNKVESLLNKGLNVMLEIDWQGAQQVRNHMPDCRSIFIMPPSVDELKRRLTSRGADSSAVIERRFRDAIEDMSHWHEFNYTVVNEDLEKAAAELSAIIRGKSNRNGTSETITVKRVNAILDHSEA
jgi:guanylate kinase